MTQDTGTGTPRETASLSVSQRQTVAVLMLCLFFVEFNVGTVFFHARGVPPEQGGTLMAAHFAGLLAGLLGLSWLRSCRAWFSPGRSGTLLRATFLCFLLLPSLLCQVSFQVTGYAGTDFLNVLQPFLWSAHLPVAFFFFFSRVMHDRQAFVFGVALSVGHLCWALFMPLVGAFGQESAITALLPTALENRYLPLLNISRNLVGAAFALLCWRLAHPNAFPAMENANRIGADDAGKTPTAGFTTKQSRLLLPFLACFFLNGFVGYLFFARLLGRSMYPEYMHLILVLLLPLAGLYVSRRGDEALFRLIVAATLTFAVFPLLLFLPVSGGVRQAVYFICAALHQILLFCGLLAFARFVPYSRFPVLMACLVWLAASVSIPGRFLAAKALPALSVPLFPVACILAGLCVASLFPLRRAFPLPEAPAAPESDALPPDVAKLEALRLAAKAKQRAFAAAFDLTMREVEILDGILRGLEREAIGAELGISDNTVKFHIRSLLKKTGEDNRQRLLHFYTDWRAG